MQYLLNEIELLKDRNHMLEMTLAHTEEGRELYKQENDKLNKDNEAKTDALHSLSEELATTKNHKDTYKRMAEQYKTALEVIRLQAIIGNRGDNRLFKVIEDTARLVLNEIK